MESLTPAYLARFDAMTGASKKCGQGYISSDKQCQQGGMVKKAAIGAAAAGAAAGITALALGRRGRTLVRRTARVKVGRALNPKKPRPPRPASPAPAAAAAAPKPRRPRVRKPTLNRPKTNMGGVRISAKRTKISTIPTTSPLWRRNNVTFRI